MIRRARKARAVNHRAFSGPYLAALGGARKTPCDSLIPNLKIFLTNLIAPTQLNNADRRLIKIENLAGRFYKYRELDETLFESLPDLVKMTI